MRCGSQETADRVLKVEDSFKLNLGWIKRCMDPEQKVIFLNTDQIMEKISTETLKKMKNRNFIDSMITKMLVDSFIEGKVKVSDISIITPFLDQQFHLEKHLKNCDLAQIYTIDKAQGLDCEVVIVSSVVHENSGRLMRDIKRLNVAFTRAKSKFILIGSYKKLSVLEPVDKMITLMEKDK